MRERFTIRCSRVHIPWGLADANKQQTNRITNTTAMSTSATLGKLQTSRRQSLAMENQARRKQDQEGWQRRGALQVLGESLDATALPLRMKCGGGGVPAVNAHAQWTQGLRQQTRYVGISIFFPGEISFFDKEIGFFSFSSVNSTFVY
jgi:hypothetical protein